MISARPFFMLLGRASVFWLTAAGLFAISIMLAGAADTEARLSLYVDAVFLAAFAYPACAGWLAGAVIQELQHSSFAATLPGLRARIAVGFLTMGLAVTSLVVGVIALRGSSSIPLLVLLAIGLGAYCLCGYDPLSAWTTVFSVVLVLAVVGSRELARIAAEHPIPTAAVSLAAGSVSLLRLFSRSTLRRKPFQAVVPFPGRFSLERSRQFERRRVFANRARRRYRGPGYLGDDVRRWVRAALHEAHGASGWKAFARGVGRAWALLLLIVVYAWLDKGEMGFGEALAKSTHDALFLSPHTPLFGEHGGPDLPVAIIIAAVGAVTAAFSPVALHEEIFHPISRARRAQVLFRGGLAEGAFFLFVVGPLLLLVGLFAGWSVGYEARFDFVPFFVRVLLATLILRPLAHWGGIRLRAAHRRKAEHTLVAVIFGITGFVVAVAVWSFVSTALFRSPVVELGLLGAALLLSQLAYRQKLATYHRTADLA